MNQFTFHECPFVNSPPPHPDGNPHRHLLPPQPTIIRTIRKDIPHSQSYSQGNNSHQYADVTLGNSPEFSHGHEPPRPIKSISYFNKQLGDSIKTNIYPRLHEGVVQVRVIPSEQRRSYSKEFISTAHKPDLLSRSREHIFPHAVTEIKESRSRERDSRMSAGGISPEPYRESFSYRHCQKSSPQKKEEKLNESMHRQCYKCHPPPPKEEKEVQHKHCYKCHPKEEPTSPIKKISTKVTSKEKQLTAEIRILTDKLADLKISMIEYETLNKNLASQLQITKEKLRARETEISVLRSKNNEYSSMMVDIDQQKQIQIRLHQEIHQLRHINQSYLLQIEDFKKKLIYHEEKNAQSMRLLQQLNDNISKKQQILKKQLQEQVLITNRHAEDKNRLEIQLSQAFHKISDLQTCHKNLQANIEEYKLDITRLRELVANNKQKTLEVTIEELRMQLGKYENEFNEHENRYSVLLAELRSKQEEYSKLQIYADQMRKEKSESFLRTEQEKSKMFSDYQNNIRQLKIQVTQKTSQIQRLNYRIRQIESKWSTSSQEHQRIIIELKQLRQERIILIRQRDQLKNDSQHLMVKNDKLYKDIQRAKERQLELNSIVANYQKDILRIEETITHSINDLANRDLDIKKWRDLYEFEKSKTEKLNFELEEKIKIIVNLEENLKKEGKVILLYKEGLTRLQQKKQVQWTNMNKVYIEQIKRLEETVRQLMDYNDNRRGQKMTIYKNLPFSRTYTEGDAQTKRVVTTIQHSNTTGNLKQYPSYSQSRQYFQRSLPIMSESVRQYTLPMIAQRRETGDSK